MPGCLLSRSWDVLPASRPLVWEAALPPPGPREEARSPGPQLGKCGIGRPPWLPSPQGEGWGAARGRGASVRAGSGRALKRSSSSALSCREAAAFRSVHLSIMEKWTGGLEGLLLHTPWNGVSHLPSPSLRVPHWNPNSRYPCPPVLGSSTALCLYVRPARMHGSSPPCRPRCSERGRNPPRSHSRCGRSPRKQTLGRSDVISKKRVSAGMGGAEAGGPGQTGMGAGLPAGPRTHPGEGAAKPGPRAAWLDRLPTGPS